MFINYSHTAPPLCGRMHFLTPLTKGLALVTYFSQKNVDRSESVSISGEGFMRLGLFQGTSGASNIGREKIMPQVEAVPSA